MFVEQPLGLPGSAKYLGEAYIVQFTLFCSNLVLGVIDTLFGKIMESKLLFMYVLFTFSMYR